MDVLPRDRGHAPAKFRCGLARAVGPVPAEVALDRSRAPWDRYPLYLLRGADTAGHNRYANVP